jgi:hypothetical protein
MTAIAAVDSVTAQLAASITAAATAATNEEELRIAVEMALAPVLEELGIGTAAGSSV